MKTKIFNMERNAPLFLYFRPVDGWTPEPPESPKVAAPEKSKPKPLPHEQRSRLTPGEIEAIKKVRANPHIPEDSKPEPPKSTKPQRLREKHQPPSVALICFQSIRIEFINETGTSSSL